MKVVSKYKPLYTYDPAKGHHVQVGILVDDVFKKPVRRHIHLFRDGESYAIQADVFQQIRDKVKRIDIVEVDTGITYSANTKIWEKYGVEDDLGHGIQRFLPCDMMDKKSRRRDR